MYSWNNESKVQHHHGTLGTSPKLTTKCKAINSSMTTGNSLCFAYNQILSRVFKVQGFLFGWLFFVWLGFLACLCLRWMDKNRISVDTWSFIATHYCHIEYIQYYMLYVGMLHPPEVNNCQFPARQKKNLSKRNRVKQHTQTSTLL